MEIKKILVTGSLGYIGSIFTPYITKNNYECISYPNCLYDISYLSCFRFNENDLNYVYNMFLKFLYKNLKI